MPDISKQPLGQIDGKQVYAVDFDAAKLRYNMDLTEGSNPCRHAFVPDGEIWVDARMDPRSWRPIILHELTECRLMSAGMPYQQAHDIANEHERTYRQELGIGCDGQGCNAGPCLSCGCDPCQCDDESCPTCGQDPCQCSAVCPDCRCTPCQCGCSSCGCKPCRCCANSLREALLRRCQGEPARNAPTNSRGCEQDGQPAAAEQYAAAASTKGDDQGIEVDPSKLSASTLNRMNMHLKKLGYDMRGANDVRNAFARGRVHQNGRLVHPDWIEAYKTATAGEQAQKQKRADKLSQQERLSNVNWERLKQLGTTTDYREAGYIAPEGHMVDLSGRREGYQGPPMRNYDHREAGGTAGMQELMSAGHIRHMPESHGLDMMVRPTDKQLGHIRNIADRAGGEVMVDFQDGLGPWNERHGYYDDPPRRWSAAYPKGTRADRIIRDIETFYDGKQPQDPPQARYIVATPAAMLEKYRAGEISSADLERYALEESLAAV